MKKLIGLTLLSLTAALIQPAPKAEADGRVSAKVGSRGGYIAIGHGAPFGYYGPRRGYYHRRYPGFYPHRHYRGYYRGPIPGYAYRYGGGGALGRVDIDVKPKDAEVYVDGSYVGKAGKFDGWPDFLWLQQGIYDISLVHPEHRTITREIAVYPRLRIDLDLTMEAGPSTPPPKRESAGPSEGDETEEGE